MFDQKEKRENPNLICLQCEYARFPAPEEQCYKTGGLICQIDQANVGKYSNCRFAKRPLIK